MNWKGILNKIGISVQKIHNRDAYYCTYDNITIYIKEIFPFSYPRLEIDGFGMVRYNESGDFGYASLVYNAIVEKLRKQGREQEICNLHDKLIELKFKTGD